MARATTADPAVVAHELRVVVGRLIRRLRAAGRIPLPQATVLGRLDREGPLTTSALAAAERVRPQSMAQTVADLERLGLVERRPDPADRRQVLLSLSAGGRAAIEAERRGREGWLAEAIDARLDARERATLERAVEILGRLAEDD
jgi:DNA-binding MarR family transcriptional regulator